MWKNVENLSKSDITKGYIVIENMFSTFLEHTNDEISKRISLKWSMLLSCLSIVRRNFLRCFKKSWSKKKIYALTHRCAMKYVYISALELPLDVWVGRHRRRHWIAKIYVQVNFVRTIINTLTLARLCAFLWQCVVY